MVVSITGIVAFFLFYYHPEVTRRSFDLGIQSHPVGSGSDRVSDST